MLDLIVSGGLAVLPAGPEIADIAVAGGKIVGIGAPGSFAAAGAARTVSATGQYVIPGGIDPHVHCGWPITVPGTTNPALSGPPEQVSRAALYGGTTSVLDFAMWSPGEKLAHSIEKRMKEWAGACFCDYGFHVMLQGKIPPGAVNAARWTRRGAFLAFALVAGLQRRPPSDPPPGALLIHRAAT